MFFCHDADLKGYITAREYHQTTLYDNILHLEEYNESESKFNFFNYNYFYITCCVFNELDTDEDGFISAADLENYKDHNLPKFVVERIFEQKGFPFQSTKANHMSYEDFVWFLFCEEDKTNEQSIGYWFRIMDLNADGVLS